LDIAPLVDVMMYRHASLHYAKRMISWLTSWLTSTNTKTRATLANTNAAPLAAYLGVLFPSFQQFLHSSPSFICVHRFLDTLNPEVTHLKPEFR
jgi:hypothetical protein